MEGLARPLSSQARRFPQRKVFWVVFLVFVLNPKTPDKGNLLGDVEQA